MTKLECDVTTCAYYCDHRCRRNSILIDGRRASQKCQTACSSYEPKDNAMNNSIHGCTPKAETDVSCKAVRCAFNGDGICNAREITVCTCGCADPCCCSETECASFQSKRNI